MGWNLVNRPRITDVLDILIVAFLLYQLLKYARESRVSQLAKGLGLLLLAAWLAEILKMRTLGTILRWVVNAGPVVIIVLFQPEIRRVLEELGNTTFLDRARSTELEIETAWLISELTQALLNMAKRRVGALIVIEKRSRLKEIIQTGTRVDAIVSQPLIENIFEPNTPLHDGSVVIRGDRIVAAACLLHLSEGSSISRDLGTRHRAGLGMSEISDATVFIVSEETGIISMARGGKLTRHMDARTLSQVLHDLYDPQITPKGRTLLLNTLRGRRRKLDDERTSKKD